MNRIYKVIWSKVKHQYVVVSELAHRDGKRSSAASKSVRTLLAVLAVCGMTAFGLGTQDVYADGASTTQSQYIAIGDANRKDATGHSETGHWTGRPYFSEYVYDEYYKNIDNHTYVYTETDDGNFWVRKGYTIEVVHDDRYTGAGGPDKDIIINAYRGENADTAGLVQSYQNVQDSMNITTLNGDELFSTNTSMYGGAVNTPTTAVSTGNEFIINEGTQAISGTTSINLEGGARSYFQPVNYDSKTGLYHFGSINQSENIVNTENLYVINGTVGVFTKTPGGNRMDDIYTGDVYGRNNEILMTGVDANGNYVSYWGAEIVDPNAPIGSMSMSTLQGKFDEVEKDIEKIHKDDIKEIQVAPTGTSTDGQGGTIGLQTNGAFDADGNPTGGKAIPGGITVTSIGGTNGNDVQVKFSNIDPDTKQTNSFTVNAGSKVVGTVNGIAAAANDTLDGLTINGINYKLGGGTATDYQLIANPAAGSEGKYTVTDGKVDLTVQNGDNAEDRKTVTIDGIASTADVAKATSTVTGDTNVNVTPDTTAEDGHTEYKVSLQDNIYLGGSQTAENNNIFLDGTNSSISVGSSSGDRVVINGTERIISGLSNTTWTPDTVNYSQSNKAATEAQLSQAISNATSEMTASDQHLVANPDGGNYAVNKETGDVTLKVQYKDEQGNTKYHDVTIEDVASKANLDALESIVGDGNYIKPGETGNVVNNDMNVTEAIGALDGAIADAAANANKHSSVHGGSNISVTEGTNPDFEGGKDYVVSLNDHITLGDKEQGTYVDVNGEDGTVTASGNISAGSFTTDNITIDGIGADGKHTGTITGLFNTTWNKDVADAIATNANGEAGTAATQGQLQQAMSTTVQYDTKDGSVDKGNISLGYKDAEGNQQYTQIHNVAAGSAPTDAVNFSQLSAVGNLAVNNYNNIQVLNGSINKLDNRIDRVGAGAAALAALHPLDFDPDAKWDFAAGYGNYRGANAVAVGAYYRPNEDVMFSVGGSMGGGENMVNAGVSLKIGAGSSNVTTSRVAMAKEIKSMRDIVAKQDAQIQKLTAMVNALVGIQSEPDTTTMFPDVPENHWAYEAVEAMAKSGLVKGYPDGEFKGDRTMTRYEFAQIVYNAIQAGAEVDARLVEEFKPELEYFHIATVAKDKDGNPTIERVRAN